MGCLTSRLWRRSAVHRLEDPVLTSDGCLTAGNHMHMAVALCNFPPHRSDVHTIFLGDRLNIISDWLFEGITRRNAEQLLMLPQNYSGCFLIRESQSCPGSYSLSIRQDRDHVHNVKHYRIHQLDNNWFYIHHNRTFSTLTQLVDYYSRPFNGTYCQLTEPCLLHDSNTTVAHIPSPIAFQRSNLNWKDLSRSMIQRQLKGTDHESLVSEGLRESMNSYFYITEELSCED
ncbi:src-like-adapter 2 isoform X2 [Rhinichthys klamathensis goyatoka]|uniref:src-like-adapter 2 isoform X2 n=1 Tax=Rhinichthys klamathensis goyatoka TaxID=3034132 RepID=UPI0024B5CDC1|nr:src-like-adapter 2 isoform X2 [Rhinichthys klamathensis goyatoka]